jgi:two-component system cell cycle sensor histidine kinase/response regulator CckA
LNDKLLSKEQIIEALRETKKKYEALFNNTNDGIFLHELAEDGRPRQFIEVNDRACKMTGYSREELLALTPLDIDETPPYAVREIVQEMLSKGQVIFETIMVAKNKDKIPIEISNHIFLLNGRKTVSSIVRDITERKRAEEALWLTRFTVENVADAVYWMDSKARILDVNETACSMLGYTREEFLNLTVLAIDPDFTADKWVNAWEKLKGQGQLTLETRHRTKEGRIIPVEIIAYYLSFGGKELDCAFARDISLRKRADEERKKVHDALQASEKLYRMLFESSGDAIFILEAEGDNAGKIVSANKAAALMHGYSIDELLTLSIRDLDTPEVAREASSRLERMLRGEWINLEITHCKKDGTIFPVEVSAGLLELGNHKYILAFDRDITDRRHMEQQLRHAQKMEVLGTLTGGISHEFNNILQAIIGYGELLDNALKDNPLRTYSNVILSSAQRASSITRGLLAYSRKQIVDRKSISLNEIIKKVEGLLSRFIGEDIDLRVVLADNKLIVNVDSNQIEQVLMNLATNAKDAMPDGGVLTISTEHISMEKKFIQAHGYGEPGEYALITVKDTGLGMDEKMRSRIFEPFFTTKGIGKGTGLGLSMVYGIVKAHNGYIDVHSALGEGTTFNIYVPAIKVDVEKVQSSAEPSLGGGSETVLVAEDDTDVRKLINTVLEKAGYEVIEAVDGEDAIEKMRENKDRIQLLLCDVIMPKKNGREVFNEIREIAPHIRALFMSGYTDNIIHEKGILEEGVNFILKPILPRELLRKVRGVLDKQTDND